MALMIFIMGFAGICVLIGLILIIKELRAPKEEEVTAVPITKLDELKSPAKQPLKKDKLLPLAQDVLEEKTKQALKEEIPELVEPVNVEEPEKVKMPQDSFKVEEKSSFLNQMEEITQSKEKFLEKENEDFKKQIEAQKEKIKELEREIEQAQAQYQKEQDITASKLSEETHALVDKIVVLQKENNDMTQELKDLKALNTQMTEKETSLNFELAKYRAQSAGLERICEDLKKQNEEISKTIKG